MRSISKVVATLVAAFLLPSFGAEAAVFKCKGKVTQIGFNPATNPGVVGVIIQGDLPAESSGMLYYCAMDTTYNGISPQQCKYIYSLFMSAFLAGKTITVSFEPAANEPQSCPAIGDWALATPVPFHYLISE